MKTNSDSLSIPSKYIIIVLVLFPMLYIINSFMPWTKEIMSGNRNYFLVFWISIFILHWSNTFLAYWYGKKSGYGLKDFGYTLSKKKTIIALTVYFLVAISFLILSLNRSGNTVSKLDSVLYNFYPMTLADKVLWIFVAISAGFCEEFVYRGFGITTLKSRKLSNWLIVLLTSISFVFIHGVAVFNMFHFYLFFGILFAILRIWRKNIILNIIIHALIDLSIITIS